jgi:hypothetical protein
MNNSHVTNPNMPGAVGYQSGADHRQDNIYFIWDQLKQHDGFMDYFRQIQSLLFVNSDLFQLYTRFRDYPGAPDFHDDLLLSTIHFIPPNNIYRLIVCLRTHPSWSPVRHILVADMDGLKHHSLTTGSTRNSGISGRSLGHFSSASARPYSNPASGYSFIEAVSEAADEEAKYPHAPQPDTTPGPPTVTDSRKPSRKAPDGYRFSCPYRQCHGKFAYRRLGDWDNHQLNYHPGGQHLNPNQYLQEDHHVNAQTPAKTETADNVATIPHPGYFRDMGVHHLTDDISFFNHDDMDDK